MFHNNYPKAYFFCDFRSLLETPGVVIWETTGAEKHVPQVFPYGKTSDFIFAVTGMVLVEVSFPAPALGVL